MFRFLHIIQSDLEEQSQLMSDILSFCLWNVRDVVQRESDHQAVVACSGNLWSAAPRVRKGLGKRFKKLENDLKKSNSPHRCPYV